MMAAPASASENVTTVCALGASAQLAILVTQARGAPDAGVQVHYGLGGQGADHLDGVQGG
jgi:hypothetical protein